MAADVVKCERWHSIFGISESLGQSKINNVNVVLLLANSNQEVVGLDISVQEVSRMDKLNSLKHLVCQHQHCLETKFTLTVV